MRSKFSALTGRAVLAQCSALGIELVFREAPTGRNNSTAYFALSGLAGRGINFSSALRFAFTFRPVGAWRV